MRRVRPVAERIASTLLGRSPLVVGHGNSLRALIGVAEGLDAAALHALNLPPGELLRYAVDDAGRPVPATASYLDPSTALPAAAGGARGRHLSGVRQGHARSAAGTPGREVAGVRGCLRPTRDPVPEAR